MRVSPVRETFISIDACGRRKGIGMDITEFEDQLGISFKNPLLLKQAFTHSSYVNEHPQQNMLDNERLEFLGDAVLELAVSQYLYHRYGDMTEGELTRLRANIVCEESLVKFAKQLQFNRYILLGRGEEQTGGRNRPALLADVFESFLGALFLDQGFTKVLSFLEEHIFPLLEVRDFQTVQDYKTVLQEFIQKYEDTVIEYEIIEEIGPSHDKTFVAQVFINQTAYETGSGRSKKEAEQEAAKKTIKRLQAKKSF